MGKKEFIALADALRLARTQITRSADGTDMRLEHWGRDTQAIADCCGSLNPKFDRDKWFQYINRKA